MSLKGIVSTVESEGARVTFIDRENCVSPVLKIAAHISLLAVGDNVAVLFFSDSMTDGLIIAKF